MAKLDLRDALAIGAAIYGIVFWAATVFMPLGDMAIGIVAVVFIAILSFCGSKFWYFKRHEPKKWLDGVLLGVVFLAVAFIMEILAMIYGLQWGWDKYLGMLMSPLAIIGLALYVIVPTIVAYMILKK
jgi:hypothetical protein